MSGVDRIGETSKSSPGENKTDEKGNDDSVHVFSLSQSLGVGSSYLSHLEQIREEEDTIGIEHNVVVVPKNKGPNTRLRWKDIFAEEEIEDYDMEDEGGKTEEKLPRDAAVKRGVEGGETDDKLSRDAAVKGGVASRDPSQSVNAIAMDQEKVGAVSTGGVEDTEDRKRNVIVGWKGERLYAAEKDEGEKEQGKQSGTVVDQPGLELGSGSTQKESRATTHALTGRNQGGSIEPEQVKEQVIASIQQRLQPGATDNQRDALHSSDQEESKALPLDAIAKKNDSTIMQIGDVSIAQSTSIEAETKKDKYESEQLKISLQKTKSKTKVGDTIQSRSLSPERAKLQTPAEPNTPRAQNLQSRAGGSSLTDEQCVMLIMSIIKNSGLMPEEISKVLDRVKKEAVAEVGLLPARTGEVITATRATPKIPELTVPTAVNVAPTGGTEEKKPAGDDSSSVTTISSVAAFDPQNDTEVKAEDWLDIVDALIERKVPHAGKLGTVKVIYDIDKHDNYPYMKDDKYGITEKGVFEFAKAAKDLKDFNYPEFAATAVSKFYCCACHHNQYCNSLLLAFSRRGLKKRRRFQQ